TYKKFPPHWGRYPKMELDPDFPVQAKRHSLDFHILPYIEGRHLYDAGNTTAAFPQYTTSLDRTTSDGTDGAGTGGTSFLCNPLVCPAGRSYSRMPDSFASGISNVVFFVTATAKGHTPDGARWHYWGGNPEQTAGVAQFLGNRPLPPMPPRDNLGP